MYLTKVVSALAITAALILSVPVSALAISASAVTLNFMCPCGTCDEALSTCECPQSAGYRSQIAGMVGRGYSEDQIIQDFKDRFGPSVLIANAAIAPSAVERPFNRKIYGYLLVIGGFTLAAFTIGRQTGRSSAPQPARGRSYAGPRGKKWSGKKGEGKNTKFREGVDDDLLDD